MKLNVLDWIALVLAIIGASNLELRMTIVDIIPQRSEEMQEFIRLLDKYDSLQLMTIGISGDDMEEIKTTANEIEIALERS